MNRLRARSTETKNLLENQALAVFAGAFEHHLPDAIDEVRAFVRGNDVHKYGMAFYSTTENEYPVKEIMVFFLQDFTASEVFLTFKDGRMFALAPHKYREMASQPMSERLQLEVLYATHFATELTKLLNYFEVDTSYRKWGQGETAPYMYREPLTLDDPEFVEKFLKGCGLKKPEDLALSDILVLVDELRRSALKYYGKLR